MMILRQRLLGAVVVVVVVVCQPEIGSEQHQHDGVWSLRGGDNGCGTRILTTTVHSFNHKQQQGLRRRMPRPMRATITTSANYYVLCVLLLHTSTRQRFQ